MRADEPVPPPNEPPTEIIPLTQTLPGTPSKDSPIEPPKTAEESIPSRREATRKRLAELLVYSWLFTVAATFGLITIDRIAYYGFKRTPDSEQSQHTRDLIAILWSSQTTLVGTALGFYFGDRESR